MCSYAFNDAAQYALQSTTRRLSPWLSSEAFGSSAPPGWHRAPAATRARAIIPAEANSRRNTAADMREGVSRAAGSAADYASDVKERISDAASGYAGSVSEFADDARRAITERSERWQREAGSQLRGGMERVLREQPLVVAVAGLAAGAAVAALFPSTKLENQTFGGTRDALADAAGRAGDRVMEAAGKAGERLKEVAEERGLSAEGLKKVAGEVADTFTSEIKGKSDPDSSASIVPDTATSRFRPEPGAKRARREHRHRAGRRARAGSPMSNLDALERDVAQARARFADDLARLRSPNNLARFKDDLWAEARETKDELIDKSKQAAKDGAQRVLTDLKDRAAANPLAAAAIGAGLAWRPIDRPPIATLLIGAGLFGLLRTTPPRRSHEPYMGIYDEDSALRPRFGEDDLAQRTAEVASAVKDKVQDWSATAGETARATATQITDATASMTERAGETLHEVRDTARESLTQATETAAS